MFAIDLLAEEVRSFVRSDSFRQPSANQAAAVMMMTMGPMTFDHNDDDDADYVGNDGDHDDCDGGNADENNGDNNNNNNFRVSNIRVSNRTLIYNVCPEAALT